MLFFQKVTKPYSFSTFFQFFISAFSLSIIKELVTCNCPQGEVTCNYPIDKAILEICKNVIFSFRSLGFAIPEFIMADLKSAVKDIWIANPNGRGE